MLYVFYYRIYVLKELKTLDTAKKVDHVEGELPCPLLRPRLYAQGWATMPSVSPCASSEAQRWRVCHADSSQPSWKRSIWAARLLLRRDVTHLAVTFVVGLETKCLRPQSDFGWPAGIDVGVMLCRLRLGRSPAAVYALLAPPVWYCRHLGLQ